MLIYLLFFSKKRYFLASISNTFNSSLTNNADQPPSNSLNRMDDLENRSVTSNEATSTASKISTYVSGDNQNSSSLLSQASGLSRTPLATLQTSHVPIRIGRNSNLNSQQADSDATQLPDNRSLIQSLVNRRGRGFGSLRIGSSSSPLSSRSQGLDWLNLPNDFSEIPVLRGCQHGARVDEAATDQASFVLIEKSKRQKECLVSIKEGKIIVNEHELDTSQQAMNFVFLRDGTMYVVEAVPEQIFHSSLLQPDDPDLIAAGMIHAVNGIPVWMDENSGHFKPYNRVGYAAAALKHRECNVSKLQVRISPYAPIDDTERSPTTPQKQMEKLRQLLEAKKISPSQSPSPSSSASQPQSPSTPSPQSGLQRTLSSHFKPSSRVSVFASKQPKPESKGDD